MVAEPILRRLSRTEQNQLELLEAILERRPTSVSRINPGAPRPLCALTDRLLAKRPEDRPRDAAEVASVLRGVGSSLAGTVSMMRA